MFNQSDEVSAQRTCPPLEGYIGTIQIYPVEFCAANPAGDEGLARFTSIQLGQFR